jgi:hypothetical protein
MGLGIMEIILLLVLLCLPIWLIVFVNVLKNDFKGNDKLIWLPVVILVPFIGPLSYFFIGRKQKVENKTK